MVWLGGTDTFSYTNQNASGCRAGVLVTVTVGNGTGQGANAVNAATVDGKFVVYFAGIPNVVYTVEHASSTTGPWTKYGNYTAPTTNVNGYGIGVFKVEESTANSPAGFYRTVAPAY